MKALDLFCGAGGASRGLADAGCDVRGVDLHKMPNYPYEFEQADVLSLSIEYLKQFDFIWASPPCQRFSTMTARWGQQDAHPDLIEPVRAMLIASGKPYVIENVPGAPLRSPTVLCGSMFGLKLRRHRAFETSFPCPAPPPHDHSYPVIGVYGNPGGSSKRDGIKFGSTADWKEAMGIDWMTSAQMSEAIPPVYSKWLVTQLTNLKIRDILV
jgi:DNA (cytosine-5)-methyltransferase 1